MLVAISRFRWFSHLSRTGFFGILCCDAGVVKPFWITAIDLDFLVINMSLPDSNTLDFVNAYTMLEQKIVAQYPEYESCPERDRRKGSVSWFIDRKLLSHSLCEDLRYCRDVRNLILHNRQIKGEYPISVNNAVIERIREIIDIVDNVPKAESLGVKTQNLFYVSRDSNVFDVLERMQRDAYTYVPLLRDGYVDGVFDMNAFLAYVTREKIVGDFDKLTISEFGDGLSLDSCLSEGFEFVPRYMLAPYVAELFAKYLQEQRCLGMVFVTEHGKSDEKLLSAITAWDMARFF